ncbi:MAG TPA: type II CRISPR RNA-guided endonuclease Cas9 [Clostridiales bacterium]|nr:type II CRISPR RNA-guided endonuclease Cas9 [Clostridiales bacterium]
MYRLGLDVGIKSVGWCVLECDENGEPIQINALNSRIFDAAEQPKTGASLAEPRRNARGLRRRIRRKSFRLERIRKLFSENGIELFETQDDLICLKDEYKNLDVVKLRSDALDKNLTEAEFARVLYSLARHRGFKSNNRVVETDDGDEEKKGKGKNKDEGKLLSSIRESEEEMRESGMRTRGEQLYKKYLLEGKPVHNKGGDYSMCVSRDILVKEIELLFEKQKEFGNNFATDENKEKYLDIFLSQRNFDEGPGKGSQYTGSHNVKKCEIYRDEDVAAKGTYTSEWATIYQKINNLSIICGGDRRRLSNEERQIAVELAKKVDKVTYKAFRKAIKLDDDYRFSALNYSEKKKSDKKKNEGESKSDVVEINDVVDSLACEDKGDFITAKNSNKIVKALNDNLKSDIELIDEIAEICTKYKSENLFRSAIAESKIIDGRLDEETIEKLSKIDMKGYGHLSLHVLREILPYLEEGMVYSDAMQKAGHNHSEHNFEKQKYLGTKEVYDAIGGVTSPVVKRALSQTVKVIDAVIRQYGSPYAINIELARDMSMSKDERDKLKKENDARAAKNEAIRENIAKLNAMPNSTNVLKYKLYEEQDHKCAYSMETLDINHLFEDGYYEIDHIIPYSRSFDDSFNNKVLVLQRENQNKRNSTPVEYFERIGRDYDEVLAFWKAVYQKRNRKKLEFLQKKEINESEWKNRALNDTRYASRMLANLIKDYLLFDEKSKEKYGRVETVKGAITSYLRRFWGVQKIREDGDKHHAVDAAIIACVTPKTKNKIERYNQIKESRKMRNGQYVLEDGEICDSDYYDKNSHLVLPYPYKEFINELDARVMDEPVLMQNKLRLLGFNENYLMNAKPFVVSRMTSRKAKGCINEATVFSSKYADNKYPTVCDGNNVIVKRTALANLKLDKNGEINGYFQPEGDVALYNALKQRLVEFDGDAKKAFATPIRKPCNSGQGNIVRTVKTYETYTGGGMILEKNKGIVKNDGMIRVDLYSKDGKYFGVPVYVADLYRGELPKRAATQNKPQNEWRVIDDTYTFEMSIYQDDLLHIENKKGIELKKKKDVENSAKAQTKTITDDLVYFIGFNRSTASIEVEDTTGCYRRDGIGTQNIGKITKCEIDVLGNVQEIKKRPKQPQPLKMLTDKEKAEKRKNNQNK